MGTELLRRAAATGKKASERQIKKARAYARYQVLTPSDEELHKVADAIGIDGYLLSGIVYAYVSLNRNGGEK